MGGEVSPELAARIWASVGVEIAPHIENKFNYGQVKMLMMVTMMLMCWQFSGIAAFTERIYCWEFCRGDKAGPSAPKSEIETADFDKLLSKLERVRDWPMRARHPVT